MEFLKIKLLIISKVLLYLNSINKFMIYISFKIINNI